MGCGLFLQAGPNAQYRSELVSLFSEANFDEFFISFSSLFNFEPTG